MMELFNFFGSLLGYLLWFLYTILKNYGVAIIFFTIIVKMALFPFTLKSQKSMAAQSRLAAKQKDLQAKYGKNQAKYNEELAKLYEKEGVKPGGGCLTTLLPFPIMLGIYYSVIYPLTNTLHISAEHIAKATDFVSRIPGSVANASNYVELEIVKNFSALKPFIGGVFSGDEVQKIEEFAGGFRFLGLDLLATPSTSDLASMMWLIPVLALLSYWGQSFVMQKMQNQPQNNQGCMKVMMYGMPLLSAYWAYIMPGAVGFYWIISALVSFAQTMVTHRFYSPEQLSAKQEASRYVTLLAAEEKVKPLPVDMQKKIADKIEATNLAQQQRKQEQQQKKNGKKSSGSANKNKGSSADYMGSKK